MSNEEYEALQDGDIIENVTTGRKKRVKVKENEDISKDVLAWYYREYKVISKAKYEPSN